MRRYDALLAALVFAAATCGAGMWAIAQSRSSTAAIGILFLPFYCLPCALLGWAFGRFWRRAPALKAVAALCFALELGVAGAFVRGGLREREKNAARDALQAQMQARIDRARKDIAALVAESPGDEQRALEAAIGKSGDDRAFLIAALESTFVSAATLDRLSRSDDMGVVLMVARNPKTPAAVLERIHRSSAYPDYYAQALAANENTPPGILREIFSKPGTQGQWLAQNPATPREVLERLALSRDAWVLRSLTMNPALDCALLRSVKSAVGARDLLDSYHARPFIEGRVEELAAKLCPNG